MKTWIHFCTYLQHNSLNTLSKQTVWRKMKHLFCNQYNFSRRLNKRHTVLKFPSLCIQQSKMVSQTNLKLLFKSLILNNNQSFLSPKFIGLHQYKCAGLFRVLCQTQEVGEIIREENVNILSHVSE